MKRLFDTVFSLLGLIITTPVVLVIAICIRLDSKGPVFFRQKRVGRHNLDFELLKFRTMYTNAESKGQLTVGMRDPRITPIGYGLRKYKLDELPQLINVLRGDMSFVGPRPEVRKYVNLYNEQQLKVLSVRPGITDFASIKYARENEILAAASDPESEYINHIMPDKLSINLAYVENNSIFKDFQIILLTLFRIVGLKKI